MSFIPFPDFDLSEYVSKLNTDTIPVWGSMTSQHMLEHMLLPLEIGQGKLVVEVVTPPEKVEKTKMLFLMSEAPLKRGFPAPFLKEGLQELKYLNLHLK
jgi:oxepin-CoA hydrolase/3-oxo-5,6-dehydrosuberyl-CoA semialdehyde dehydrogenase